MHPSKAASDRFPSLRDRMSSFCRLSLRERTSFRGAKGDYGPLNAVKTRPKSRIDWPAWIALAWAIVFGVLYVEMILRCRAPGLHAAIRRALFSS